MLAVEDNRRWGLGGAGHAGGNKRVGKPGESGAGHAVCEPRARWGTRQGLRGIARDACETPRKHGVVSETVGLMAVRIAGGHLGETLGEEVPERMVPRRRRALVTHGGGQPFGAADLAIQTPQQAGAKIRRPGPARNIGPHGIAREGRKMPLFGCRRGQKQTSGGFYGIACSYYLFSQRLARGLCIFMNNSG